MSTMPEAQRNITGFWSMVAPGYEAHPNNVPTFDSPLHHAWVDELRELLPAPVDALDVATGTGFVALILAGLGHRVTAVDLSADMLELAEAAAAERGQTIRFRPDDAVAPAFEPGSFDVVTNRHFLWTLREPDRALSNWRALLRQGGLLVCFDGFWFDPEPGPHESEPEPFRRHYTAETRAELPFMHLDQTGPIVAAMERNGYENIDVVRLEHLAADPEAGVPYRITAECAPNAL